MDVVSVVGGDAGDFVRLQINHIDVPVLLGIAFEGNVFAVRRPDRTECRRTRVVRYLTYALTIGCANPDLPVTIADAGEGNPRSVGRLARRDVLRAWLGVLRKLRDV